MIRYSYCHIINLMEKMNFFFFKKYKCWNVSLKLVCVVFLGAQETNSNKREIYNKLMLCPFRICQTNLSNNYLIT